MATPISEMIVSAMASATPGNRVEQLDRRRDKRVLILPDLLIDALLHASQRRLDLVIPRQQLSQKPALRLGQPAHDRLLQFRSLAFEATLSQIGKLLRVGHSLCQLRQ